MTKRNKSILVTLLIIAAGLLIAKHVFGFNVIESLLGLLGIGAALKSGDSISKKTIAYRKRKKAEIEDLTDDQLADRSSRVDNTNVERPGR